MVETILEEATKYFFHLILIGLSGAVALVWKRIMAVQDGLQMVLMDRLVQEHDYYTNMGYIPLLKKAMYKRKHDAYLGLGANGILDQTYDEVMSLPTKEGDAKCSKC